MADNLGAGVNSTEIEDRSWWWKCCQQLKVADRVQLVMSGSDGAERSFPADLCDGDAPQEARYTAWVDDIEDDKIVLGVKLEHALALQLQPGQKLTFKRAQEDGIWIYEGVVSADRAIKVEISRPLNATRIQRREYCRVAVQRETSFAKVDNPEIGQFGVARDLSGGGLSMAVNDKAAAAVGDRLQIHVPLDNEVVSMHGVVRRVAAADKPGYDFLLGIEFVDPLMIDQDKIIGFVFTHQRKLRKMSRFE